MEQRNRKKTPPSDIYDSIKILLDRLASRISSKNLESLPSLSLLLGDKIAQSISEGQQSAIHKKLIALFGVLQIFAYQIVSKFPIDVLTPTQCQEWLDKQLHEIPEDFILLKEFFSLRILPYISQAWDDIFANSPFIPSNILNKSLSSIIGPLFSEILPLATRKQLASYFTKPLAAKLLVHLLIRTGEEHVFDPACGAGQLLQAVAQWKSNYYEHHENSFSFSGSLYGIELVPIAAKIGAISLFPWSRITLGNSKNSLSIISGDTFSTLPSVSWADQKFDIIIANPPFTKHQNINPEFKEFLQKRSNNQKFPDNRGYKSDKSIGLHFYYLDLINVLLPPGGRCGLIIPLNISYSHTGKDILLKFLQSIQIDYLIGSEKETAFSEGSNMTEIMIIGTKIDPGKKKSSESKHFVHAITLLTTLSDENLPQILSAMKGSEKISSLVRKKKVSQNALISDLGKKGWHWLFKEATEDPLIEKIRPSLITIKDLILQKHLKKERGVNVPTDFFFLPNPSWKIISQAKEYISIESNKFNVPQLHIPRSYLIPILRKPEYYKDTPFIHQDRLNEYYLLSIPPQDVLKDQIPPSISRYLDWGMQELNITNRSNTKTLGANWFTLGYREIMNRRAAPIILSFKWDPRYRSFLVNWTPTPILAGQAFWLFYGSSPEFELGFTCWLNSTLGMRIVGEHASFQRRVWRQLTGPAIDQILIPTPAILIQLGSKYKNVCLDYLNANQFDSLKNQLQYAIELLKQQQSNPRILLDQLIISLLFPNSNKSKITHDLLAFYHSFKVDLQNSLEFLD